jgi:hypothetical protein
MDKKGSIAANQLVIIILLITGFAIVILVFSQINWTGQIDREVCHQSVILRATIPSAGQTLVPLKCKTSKLCVTSGIIGGKCEEDFQNAKGITKNKVSEVKQVEKLISKEIVDCWTMMGEGKVSLFSQYWANTFGVGSVYPTCVICSRIAFDEKLDLDLDNINVLKYMREHKIPNGNISYYAYLTEEGGQFSVDIDSLEVKNIEEGKSKEGEVIPVVDEEDSTIIDSSQLEFENPKESKEEMAILFMQISAPGQIDALLNLGKGVLGIGAAGAYFAGPSLVAKGIKAVGVKGGLITLAIAAVGAGIQQLNVVYNRGVTAGYCGDISVGEEARNGCSVVRAVNYNLEEIQSYCSVIESIP